MTRRVGAVHETEDIRSTDNLEVICIIPCKSSGFPTWRAHQRARPHRDLQCLGTVLRSRPGRDDV
jgi:hypothetical protein